MDAVKGTRCMGAGIGGGRGTHNSGRSAATVREVGARMSKMNCSRLVLSDQYSASERTCSSDANVSVRIGLYVRGHMLIASAL